MVVSGNGTEGLNAFTLREHGCSRITSVAALALSATVETDPGASGEF
jgi:hypothetical protein